MAHLGGMVFAFLYMKGLLSLSGARQVYFRWKLKRMRKRFKSTTVRNGSQRTISGLTEEEGDRRQESEVRAEGFSHGPWNHRRPLADGNLNSKIRNPELGT